MSPNSLASLMRCATSLRFSVESSSSSSLSFSSPSGVRMTSFGNVTLVRGLCGSGLQYAKPRCERGRPRPEGLSERSSIARPRRPAEGSGGARQRPACRIEQLPGLVQRRGRSAEPAAAPWPAPARAAGGLHTRGRTCAGSGPHARSPRCSAARSIVQSSSSRISCGPGCPSRPSRSSWKSQGLPSAPRASITAAAPVLSNASCTRRASFRPPVMITGAGSELASSDASS